MTDFSGRTALIAGRPDAGLSQMLSGLNIRTLTAEHESEALSILRRERIDFLFADLLLPGSGCAQLFRTAQRQYTQLKPGCAATCLRGFPAGDCGYPVLERPYRIENVQQILQLMLRQTNLISDGLHRRIGDMLDSLGFPAHPGKEYLIDAIGLACGDSSLSSALSRRLYPQIASHHGTKPAHVERAIRHCIDVAWKQGPAEEQYRLFGNTIDAQRGKPTIGQMIAHSADILRLEGSL